MRLWETFHELWTFRPAQAQCSSLQEGATGQDIDGYIRVNLGRWAKVRTDAQRRSAGGQLTKNQDSWSQRKRGLNVNSSRQLPPLPPIYFFFIFWERSTRETSTWVGKEKIVPRQHTLRKIEDIFYNSHNLQEKIQKQIFWNWFNKMSNSPRSIRICPILIHILLLLLDYRSRLN